MLVAPFNLKRHAAVKRVLTEAQVSSDAVPFLFDMHDHGGWLGSAKAMRKAGNKVRFCVRFPFPLKI